MKEGQDGGHFAWWGKTGRRFAGIYVMGVDEVEVD